MTSSLPSNFINTKETINLSTYTTTMTPNASQGRENTAKPKLSNPQTKTTTTAFKSDLNELFWGWKDKTEVKETESSPAVFTNKEKVLVTCSSRINYRYRHLMLNVVSLLPHCKKDNKVESKSSKGATLNELVELKSCSSCLFFEEFAFRYSISSLHTMEELKLTGNHLRGSRSLLYFSSNFDNDAHWKLVKEMITQIFGIPKEHRKSKPYLDHVFNFSVVDGHIWFRNYQIRALEKRQKAGKYAKKVKAKKRRKMHELSNPLDPNEFADMWKE
ncbi:hypothetical protein Dsin_022453 [Dipteronia sinensis]|uniref:Brix domain-containing protein n=1 Tax=Dipteronia sinensis TaxID=43782 RepID=A0AAE0A1S4_9ROSI|nr:hypothetical protein Dsin_022453 [Dipteronia sinensis]